MEKTGKNLRFALTRENRVSILSRRSCKITGPFQVALDAQAKSLFFASSDIDDRASNGT